MNPQGILLGKKRRYEAAVLMAVKRKKKTKFYN